MVGNVVAHSDWPPACSDTPFPQPIHFDDSEHNWTSRGAQPGRLDIKTFAIHEIGHLLGLGHSGDVGSIMLPSFPTNFAQHTLGPDDTEGLRFRYPAKGERMWWNIRPFHAAATCLEVTDNSQANGAKIQLSYTNYGSNQNFRPEYVGGGAYRFVAEHSGKVLDVFGASHANGAQLVQWDWYGGDNQKFRVDTPIVGPQFEGYQRITAVHSGKVIEVANGSTAAGGKIHQWDWVGVGHQLWNWPMWDSFD